MTLIKIDKEYDQIYSQKTPLALLRSFVKGNIYDFDKQNVQLLQVIEQSTSYINSQFTSRDDKPIDLYIVPTINNALEEGYPSNNKTKDDGGVFYVSNPGRPDP